LYISHLFSTAILCVDEMDKTNLDVEQGRQNVVVAVSTALTVIASSSAHFTFASTSLTSLALVVGLRLFTRSFVVGRMFPDDWAMVATMVFAYTFLLELTISIKSFNAGYSGSQLNVEEMTGILEVSRHLLFT
jgi:hypothetical protein